MYNSQHRPAARRSSSISISNDNVKKLDKLSGEQSAKDIDVVVSCHDDKEHPIFTVNLRCAGSVHEACHRFSVFKTFEELLSKHLPAIQFKCSFPRSYKRNVFGIKLNEGELEVRRGSLQRVSNLLIFCS